MKDWSGNKKRAFICNGASNHTDAERQKDDYYATEPRAVQMLLEKEQFSKCIWEPACGEGHISEVLKNNGYAVISTDKVNRGYGEVKDFLIDNDEEVQLDIITNPPYKYAREFVQKAIEIVKPGHKVAMFLKLTFLEGKERRKMFEKYPPKMIYVASGRLQCAKNGDFDTMSQTAVCYAWFVWEKGYEGRPMVDWIN